MTALALIPLLAWFLLSLAMLPAYDYATLHAFVARPVVAVLAMLLAGSVLYHAKLGLAVVVEDYVHGGMKVALLVLINFATTALAVAALYSILRISLGSS